MKDRSVSGSTKFPVVVLTGSSAYPDVCGSPRMVGAVTSTGWRVWVTPAAWREASRAASETVEMAPEPPAASNAAATVSTHRVSFVLFAPNVVRAVVIPDVSMLHQEHFAVNSVMAPSRVPFCVVTMPSAPVTFDEYVRRSSGRAELTAPDPPGAGWDHVVTVGACASTTGFVGGPAGGLSRPRWSSIQLFGAHSFFCRSAHSLACFRRSRSDWAASFMVCTSTASASRADAMFVQSSQAARAFASNTSA